MELQNIKNEHLNLQDAFESIVDAFPDIDFEIKERFGHMSIIAKHSKFNLYFGVHQCEDWQDRTRQRKYVSVRAETKNRHAGMSSPNDSYEEAIESVKPFLERECGYKPPQRTAKQLSLFDV